MAKQPMDPEVKQELNALRKEFFDIKALVEAEQDQRLEKWSLQRELLPEPLENFGSIRLHTANKRIQHRRQKSWDDDFKCDGLPHSFEPRTVQWYISKWEFDMDDEMRMDVHWSLQRDELSILTQDFSIPDNTLATIKAARVEGSEALAKRLRDIDYVLDGIRETVHTDSGYTKDQKQKLQTLRNLIHKDVTRELDIYTFRLLKNMEKEMAPVKTYIKIEEDTFPPANPASRGKPVEEEKIDVTLLEYTFDDSNISFYLWALRDVPQPPRTRLDNFSIRLASFGGMATFAYFPAMQEFAFRSFWIPQDHYSVYCPTHSLSHQPPKMVDLLKALNQEWEKREELHNAKIEFLRSLHAEFENSILARSAEQQLQKQSKGKDAKKGAPKKPKKVEKFTFGDANMYDSQPEFINIEDNRSMKQLWGMYPDVTGWQRGDINLRSQQILGGVFHFEFLPKPTCEANYFLKQVLCIRSRPCELTNFQSVKLKTESVSTHSSDANIPSAADSKQPSAASVPKKNVAVTGKSAGVESKDEQVQADPNFESEKPFDKNVLMIDYQIQLSPNVMWLVPPTVCYWEPWEYSAEFERLPEDQKKFFRNYDASVDKMNKRLFGSKSGPRSAEKVVSDFDMQNIPQGVDLKELCRDVILPTLPYHYRTIIDIVIDKKIQEEISRKERILKGLGDSAQSLTADLVAKPKAELTPPTPMFVQRETVFKHVRVVNRKSNEDDTYAMQSLREISSEMEKQNEVLLPVAAPAPLPEDEFRPPNILFSEFYKQIADQSALEAADNTEMEKTTEKLVRIRSDVGETESMTPSRGAIKKPPKKPKGKKQKGRRDSKKSKDFPEEIASTDKRQDFLHGLPSTEFRSGMIQEGSERPKGRWCTRKITDQKYNDETKTITFRSPCFGAYAFVTPRYLHMPFKSWRLIPDPEGRDVVLLLMTPYINLEIHVTQEGYRLQIARKSAIPLDPNMAPVSLYRFKKLLSNIGLNIFPARDAGCYVKDIVEKHLSMEYHTYYVMACFCRYFQFQRSPWNQLSHRRQIVMNVRNISPEARAAKKDIFDVLITPSECYRTKVSEQCSMNLNEINIDYDPDPPEQEYEADLFFLLKSEVPLYNFKEFEEAQLSTMYNIAQLLWSIRPLSFS